MRKNPFKFKLQNGLHALYQPPMSIEIQQLIERCTPQAQALFAHEMPFVFAIKIDIEDEHLHLVYLTLDHQPSTVIHDLANEMQCLHENRAIIHGNAVHLPNEPANKALANAVANKLKPALAMLLTS